jgi:DNA-binding CsgD family transcriptional regulator
VQRHRQRTRTSHDGFVPGVDDSRAWRRGADPLWCWRGRCGSAAILRSMTAKTIHARVLDLVGEVSAFLELDELRDGLLAAIRTAVPCDYVSLNQVGSDPEQNWSIVEPPMPIESLELFYRLAHQNPLAERHLRTRDGRPYRISDVVTAEQFRETDLYRELYAPIGIEYQISFALPSAGEEILAIALSRCETDFTDEERELLAVARPHLIQIYRNALQHTAITSGPAALSRPTPDQNTLQRLGLTPAQARVLSLIVGGRSTSDIAGELRISERTVQKHLQRVYHQLGVSDRSGAIHRAWQTTLPSVDT